MDATQLSRLFELAKTARDAAAARLARLEQQAQQAREHLQTLVSYADDYALRLQTQPGDALDPAAQLNKRAFLARLRGALQAQQGEVGAREQACAASRADLAVCQRKIKSLEALIQRRHIEASRQEARREQRHTDEAAQRTSMAIATQFGSSSTQDLHRL